MKWSLSTEQQRHLFLEVSLAFEAQSKDAKSQQFLLKYLATYEGSTMAPEDKHLAAKGAVGAIRNPIVCFMERHNLLGMSAIAQLKGDSEHSGLFALLHIFSVGKLKDYMDLHEANPGMFEKYTLDHEACCAHMRLLSLTSLATEHEEIPYSAIAETLSVPLEEVEAWVVRAITSKLIDAKMDQLAQVVMISRCTHRSFAIDQWTGLSEKLKSWKANVRTILDTVQKAKIMQEGAATSE